MAELDLPGLRARFEAEAAGVRGREDLERLRTLLLGKKAGLLSTALKGLGAIGPEERARLGRELNQLKDEVESRLGELGRSIETGEAAAAAASLLEGVYAAQPVARGARHPLTLIREELETLFLEMGYAVADGPEVEDDFHNFGALNMPADHPARDMQDTLYLAGGLLLRTHTSNVQIRTMETGSPPIRMVSAGRCYRRDTADLTHSPMFHQIEGLAVDQGISMADLKGTLAHLAQRLFGSTDVRLRPSFFPFTEPSAELDISCFACARRGCPLCKGSGWIELGGCGMVDPNVFAAVGIDPERWTGFAFGFGLERAAILRYGIDSIRLFFDNDLRFLEQFPASS